MKKLILILTFLVSTIFLLDNVSAEELTMTNYYKSSASTKWSISYFLEQNTDYRILYEKTNENDSNIHMAILSNNTTYKFCTDNLYYNMYVLHCFNVVGEFKYFYFNSPLTSGFSQVVVSDEPFTFDSNGYPVNHGILYSYGAFNNNHNNNYSINSLSADAKDAYKAGVKNYFANYSYLDNSGNIYVSNNTTPKIKLTKESETSVTILGQEYVTDMTVNIAFSLIDNDKYLYQYRWNDNLWTNKTMSNDNFSLKFSENGTLYVQILDKTTREYITSATFTISQINYDSTPYIEFGEITPDSCKLNDYIICQSLRINSHITNFNKYKFIVIDHTQNITEEFKEMTIYKTYYINSDIEVRIVDKNTSEIIDIKGFNIRTIDEVTENLGQYITKECEFAKYGNNYLCNYYFYNYNPDIYKYYYGTSSSDFEELKLETGTESVFVKTIFKLKEGLGQLKDIPYSKNTTVYFRVTSIDTGELIYTTTFNISYDEKLEESGKSNIFNLFKDLNINNPDFKENIEYVWKKISNSTIYEYILILISGTLIIIIINAIKG